MAGTLPETTGDASRQPRSTAFLPEHIRVVGRMTRPPERRPAHDTIDNIADWLLDLPPVEAWRSRIGLEDALATIDDARVRRREERRLENARRRPVDGLYGVQRVKGDWRIRDNKPLVYHLDEKHSLAAREAFAGYVAMLDPDRRVLIDRFELVDVAFKVVGIGSVGTFCAVGLYMTVDDQPLLLQLKEATESVLARYAGPSRFENQGQRVVVGQRLMQAASDVFLEWTQAPGEHRQFYVRHLKNAPFAHIAEDIQEEALEFSAMLCGRSLARAHARSGEAARISGYLGKGPVFDGAVAEFAAAYADQSAADHKELLVALKSGRLAAET
jgi:hypothetical protein